MENGLEILDQDKPIEPSVGSPWEFGVYWSWRIVFVLFMVELSRQYIFGELGLEEWLAPLGAVALLVYLGFRYKEEQKPTHTTFKQMSMAIMAVSSFSAFGAFGIALLWFMYIRRYNLFYSSEGSAYDGPYFFFEFLIPTLSDCSVIILVGVILGGVASIIAGFLNYKHENAENQE